MSSIATVPGKVPMKAIGIAILLTLVLVGGLFLLPVLAPRTEITQTLPAQPSDQAPSATVDPATKTLNTLRKVDDHPLYTMTYHGDYDLNIPQTTAMMQPAGERAWACSLFAALADPKQAIYGRNFDWEYNPALLLFTDPSDGYASVSMVDIHYLGFERGDLAALESLEGRKPLLRAPLLPFDGMNEHGLTIGMAAVDTTRLPNAPDKPTIGSLRIIRLMLDRAKDTAEALTLFQNYNIDFSGGPPIHYLLADPTGAAAVVELKDGKVQILRNQQSWQAATNFYLNGSTSSQRQQDRRYRTVDATLNLSRGALSAQKAMALLADVAQPHTRWSVVYEMSTGQINLAMSRRYEQVYQFSLPMASGD